MGVDVVSEAGRSNYATNLKDSNSKARDSQTKRLMRAIERGYHRQTAGTGIAFGSTSGVDVERADEISARPVLQCGTLIVVSIPLPAFTPSQGPSADCGIGRERFEEDLRAKVENGVEEIDRGLDETDDIRTVVEDLIRELGANLVGRESTGWMISVGLRFETIWVRVVKTSKPREDIYNSAEIARRVGVRLRLQGLYLQQLGLFTSVCLAVRGSPIQLKVGRWVGRIRRGREISNRFLSSVKASPTAHNSRQSSAKTLNEELSINLGDWVEGAAV
ncbi:hypothetical protein PPACK8108_LOCUS6152 [Phakopsora pachyrhizi]|uniref:Uncharacterized protein n=1 Tax=Phakopsora pachyrhizi TaxID=170000 RepID=A0AAV0AT78_PHAPC|nr:hypothetical protein PPACK8108_LOCUS6152 [Phakopsora pachyrhizi]